MSCFCLWNILSSVISFPFEKMSYFPLLSSMIWIFFFPPLCIYVSPYIFSFFVLLLFLWDYFSSQCVHAKSDTQNSSPGKVFWFFRIGTERPSLCLPIPPNPGTKFLNKNPLELLSNLAPASLIIVNHRMVKNWPETKEKSNARNVPGWV